MKTMRDIMEAAGMLSAQRSMERELDHLSSKYAKTIEEMANKILSGYSRKLSAFNASMGVVCFYGPDGQPLDDEQCPKAARQLIEFANKYEDVFGSPGVYVELGK